eukprot:c16137_g1_i1.p2 GENE.c16137_g1_i1~~c16137_g1_i1.p2  ORF type:complete len:306 (-),score=133.48 c16137_g1_i1:30-947(-)
MKFISPVCLLCLFICNSISVPVLNTTQELIPRFEKVRYGPVGHSLVGQVAQSFISDNAFTFVSGIIPNGDLAAVSDWADQIRSDHSYAWSFGYHYVNTPAWACTFDQARDCPLNDCLTSAIANYTQRLTTTTGEQQQEALKFLVHFLGDIHQPLHAGFGSDKGGNGIKVEYFSKQTNLHAVWDTPLVLSLLQQDYNGNQASFINETVQRIQNDNYTVKVSTWLTCPNGHYPCAEVWANEAVQDACQYAYVLNGEKIQAGDNLGQDYFDQNSEILKLLFAKAGYRLAALLNLIVGSSSSINSTLTN